MTISPDINKKVTSSSISSQADTSSRADDVLDNPGQNLNDESANKSGQKNYTRLYQLAFKFFLNHVDVGIVWASLLSFELFYFRTVCNKENYFKIGPCTPFYILIIVGGLSYLIVRMLIRKFVRRILEVKSNIDPYKKLFFEKFISFFIAFPFLFLLYIISFPLDLYFLINFPSPLGTQQNINDNTYEINIDNQYRRCSSPEFWCVYLPTYTDSALQEKSFNVGTGDLVKIVGYSKKYQSCEIKPIYGGNSASWIQCKYIRDLPTDLEKYELPD